MLLLNGLFLAQCIFWAMCFPLCERKKKKKSKFIEYILIKMCLRLMPAAGIELVFMYKMHSTWKPHDSIDSKSFSFIVDFMV